MPLQQLVFERRDATGNLPNDVNNLLVDINYTPAEASSPYLTPLMDIFLRKEAFSLVVRGSCVPEELTAQNQELLRIKIPYKKNRLNQISVEVKYVNPKSKA